MTEEKKLKLCQQVFESAPYPLRVSRSKTNAKLRCISRKVILMYTFVMVYSAKIASIKCPIWRKLTINSFYLGSTLEVPGMIAFMRIPPFVEMLPDAHIFGLNSEGLLVNPESKNKQVAVIPYKPTPIPKSIRDLLEKPVLSSRPVTGLRQRPEPRPRSVSRKKERPLTKK